MAKAVFIQNEGSRYRDAPGEWYHFPNLYLSRVAATVGDWVVFFASKSGGSRGYYGVQRVERIVPDDREPNHSLAILDRGSELGFERDVPRLRASGELYETGLPRTGGSNASAVRLISDADFSAIVTDGLRASPRPEALPRVGQVPGLAEAAESFDAGPLIRERELTSRAFRDAAFARQVKTAYAARCAMSGLALRNGGGRPEVEAAHIRSVEAGGPDTVRNGLALSGTLHWMFDRGLVSVDHDHSILVAKGSIADEVADRLLTTDRRLLLPSALAMRPHPTYLDWHRREVFKG